MIPYKKIFIETDSGSDELLTRLNWQTDQTENFLFPKTNTLTSMSKKPLIGKTDYKRQRFTLTRMRPFFETYFPQYFINGQIQRVENGVTVRFKFTPGLLTSLILLYFIYAIGLTLYYLFSAIEDRELLLKSFFLVLVIALIAIFLSIRELNKTTEIILTILKMK